MIQARRNITALLFILVSIASAGCIHWPGPGGDPRIMKLYGGEDGYELIAIPALAKINAYRVERIHGSPTAVPSQRTAIEPKKIGGATVMEGPVTPTAAELQQLSAILKDTSTYNWDESKGCIFNPDVAVRFAGHDTTLDVVLCFSCRQLAAYKNGELLGMEYFDDRAPALKALAKRWFPDLNTH